MTRHRQPLQPTTESEPQRDGSAAGRSASERIADLEGRVAALKASLARQEALFRSVVENTPAAVAILDTRLRYVAASRRYAKDP